MLVVILLLCGICDNDCVLIVVGIVVLVLCVLVLFWLLVCVVGVEVVV